MQRPVETQGTPRRLDLLYGRTLADEEVGRVTTGLKRQEADERHADNDDDALEQPPDDIRTHGSLRLVDRHRSEASKISTCSSRRAVHEMRSDTP